MIYPQVSSALPPDATTKLVAASKVKPTPDDRLARAKAIDAAIRYARLWYPHLFRHDEISP